MTPLTTRAALLPGNVLTIDSTLRTITIPEKIHNLGVETDANVQRLRFSMPRTYGDVDLSDFSVRINYQNAKGEGDVYAVTDAELTTANITFSWLVGPHALAYKGKVKFIVCLKKLDEAGDVDQAYHTTVASLPVLEGLETCECIVEDHPDVLEQILLRLDNLEKNGPGSTTPGTWLPLPSNAATVGQFFQVEEVDANGVPTKIKAVPAPAGSDSGQNAVYIATDYGISPEADDNTPAIQALLDMVSAKGGGIVFFPVGTYRIRRTTNEYAIWIKNNVSIIGENRLNTVFKQVDNGPYAAFQCRESADAPLLGCTFANFTVDAYETGDVNEVWGKGFRGKYLRKCVFRDLLIAGTPATGLGIDFLDQVDIDNVITIDCGRTYTGTQPGSSGIGIGAGGWENENFTASNCIAIRCGQFGFFVESQPQMFGYEGHHHSKGFVISNCISRGGLNHGIGLRGVANATVSNCQSYENAGNGVYLDGDCANVLIASVSATANSGHGIRLNPDAESVGITVKGCSAADNTGNGIQVSAASDGLCLMGNNTRGNAIGLSIAEGVVLNDAAVYGNVFMDGTNIPANVFSGNKQYIDVTFTEDDTQHPSRIELSANDLTVGVKLNPDGTEGTTGGGQASGYLDVRGINGNIKITTTGNADSLRVCQYDSDKNSLVTDAAMVAPTIEIEKLDGCAYIRLYYSSLGGSVATIESVVIEQG